MRQVRRLLLATPTCGRPLPQYIVHRDALVDYTRDQGIDVIRRFSLGSILPNQRTSLVRQAKALGVDAIMWIDDDMTFPAEGAIDLIASEKLIVGANYVNKQRPAQFISRGMDMQQFKTSELSFGEAQVRRLGFGFVLTRMEAFAEIAAPWFAMPPREDDPETVMGEDWFFCERAEKAGVPIFIDHELSRRVRHWGLDEFGWKDATEKTK